MVTRTAEVNDSESDTTPTQTTSEESTNRCVGSNFSAVIPSSEPIELISPPSDSLILVEGIAIGSRQAYRCFEQWSIAQSPYEEVQNQINKVNVQGREFHQIMTKSTRVAELGKKMADDAKFLCKKILDGNLTERNQMLLVKDMIKLAKEGAKISQEVENSCRGVRQSLFEVAKSIPHTVTHLEAKRTLLKSQASNRQTAALGLDAVSLVAAVAAIFFPPIMAVIPFTAGASRFARSKAKECIAEAHDILDAISMCRELANDLTRVIDTVSAMRDWWSNDVNRLEKIARDGSNLADIEEVLVEKMEDEWREVGQQYTWYNSSLKLLGDTYTTPRNLVIEV